MNSRCQRIASLFSFLFLLFAFGLLPTSACAKTSDWQGDNEVAVRLLSASDTIGDKKILELGLEVQLAPNWHTYWRTPGIAGSPPQIEWKKNKGNYITATKILFPAPKRYINYGMETIGYTGKVTFPIIASVDQTNTPLDLQASVRLLICKTLCVPKVFTLSLSLPAGSGAKSPTAMLIESAKEKLPSPKMPDSLSVGSTEYGDDVIRLTVESSRPIIDPDIFVESKNDLVFKSPTIELGRDKMKARLTLKLEQPLGEGKRLEEVPLHLTFVSSNASFEINTGKERIITLADLLGGEEENLAIGSRLVILGFALLGGFLLNLMPCVLPVLSIKLMSLIKHSGLPTSQIRASLLMNILGILTAFLALALITALFKGMGLALGWGLQYQQPAFLLFIVVVMGLFGANMVGLYEIPLPRFIAEKLKTPEERTKAGDFATGAFATLLATPCSAPFLGTAVSFALMSGFIDIVLVFLCLGLGLSLPYMAILIKPQWISRFPKPGMWMLYLKKTMGVILLMTTVWYGTIFASSLSFGKETIGQELPDGWIPFSQETLDYHLSHNKVVFVDVTADWCLTCKANKLFVLSDREISQRLFNNPSVVALRADWTRSTDDVTNFMKRYNRYGVPFNVVIGAGEPEGIPLPELLDKRTVLDALEQAQGAEKVK